MDKLQSVGQSATEGVSQAGQQVGQTAQSAGSKGYDAAQNTSQQTQQAVGGGTDEWNAMSEEQKKQTFDSLPEEKKQGKTYLQWLQEGYQHQKENWMPWIEDLYLKWFTKDNKASYATKDTLNKSKVTGVEQVDNLQDGVNNLVAGQVGQGGLLQPAGDMASKEGVNRAERQGKDEKGSYGGAAASYTDPVVNSAQSVGNTAWSGAKSAGSYVGGMFAKKEEAQQK